MARTRSISPGGTRGTVFKEVARSRRADAAVLLEHRRYAGAVYLAGYAVECLLKWAVTARRNLIYLPAELEVHDWDTLLGEAGIEPTLHSEPTLSAIYSELVERWAPELRYLAKEPKAKDAQRLCQNMNLLYAWIVEQTI